MALTEAGRRLMSVHARDDATCTINGRRTSLEGHPMARLLDAIRATGLTGTKEGCGEGECGACGVLLDGVLVNSCLTPLAHADGASITTIEGVADRRDAARSPGGVSRVRRRAVRHLHAGHGARGVRAAVADAGADGRGRPRRARREPVPLHRLHAHLRVRARGGEAAMMPLLDDYQLVVPALARRGARRSRAPAGSAAVRRRHRSDGRARGRSSAGRALRQPAELPRAARHRRTTAWRSRDRRADDLHGDPRSALLARDYPLLGMAARETGGVATQNRGTIGGNIANASPAADTPPVLLVYDAELEIVSAAGHAARAVSCGSTAATRRWISRPGEIVGGFIIPQNEAGTRLRRKLLPQSRHAPRAGDLEGLLRRTRSAWTTGAMPGRADRARQRRADRDPRAGHGRRAPRPAARRGHDRRRRADAPRPRSRRSTTSARPRAIARASPRNLLREFLLY